MAMDHELGSFEGLHVSSFAKEWKVSTRTVHRDLDEIRGLGHFVVCKKDSNNGRHMWHYEGGVEWVFVCNMPCWIRQVLNSFKNVAEAERFATSLRSKAEAMKAKTRTDCDQGKGRKR